MKKQNEDFIRQQEKIARNKKIFNDLYYLTKRQQEGNGYKYSEKAIQYNEILK